MSFSEFKRFEATDMVVVEKGHYSVRFSFVDSGDERWVSDRVDCREHIFSIPTKLFGIKFESTTHKSFDLEISLEASSLIDSSDRVSSVSVRNCF